MKVIVTMISLSPDRRTMPTSSSSHILFLSLTDESPCSPLWPHENVSVRVALHVASCTVSECRQGRSGINDRQLITDKNIHTGKPHSLSLATQSILFSSLPSLGRHAKHSSDGTWYGSRSDLRGENWNIHQSHAVNKRREKRRDLFTWGRKRRKKKKKRSAIGSKAVASHWNKKERKIYKRRDRHRPDLITIPVLSLSIRGPESEDGEKRANLMKLMNGQEILSLPGIRIYFLFLCRDGKSLDASPFPPVLSSVRINVFHQISGHDSLVVNAGREGRVRERMERAHSIHHTDHSFLTMRRLQQVHGSWDKVRKWESRTEDTIENHLRIILRLHEKINSFFHPFGSLRQAKGAHCYLIWLPDPPSFYDHTGS